MRFPGKAKGKVSHAPQESVGGCSFPSSIGLEPVGGEPLVCDVWPLASATKDLRLPTQLQDTGWYHIILLGDRGTCVLTTCPGLHLTAGRLGFELTTY